MIWLALFLLAAPVEPLLTLLSDRARYCGHEVELEGSVEIDHLGSKVTADAARITTKEEEVEEIELHGNVEIALPKGGSLSCDHAFLRADSFQGRFSGSPVRYCELREGQWVRLECERMDIEANPAQEVRDALLQRIEASGSVVIAHGERITATADEVIYLAGQERERIERTLPSDWRTLLPSNEGAGHLLVRIIDTPCEVVILSGNVDVVQNEIGQLKTDGSIYLVRSLLGDRRSVDRITSCGATQVAFADGEGGRRRLACHGRVVVDQSKRQITFKGTERQLHYFDSKGELFADEMQIDYLGSTEGLKGSKVVVSGGIRLRNHPDGGDIPQLMGMADRLEYDPDNEMMMLEANRGNRVVFLDEEQDAKVSARKVLYDRQDQSIEGVGNVRFNLSDHELVNLRNIFAQE